MYDQLIKSFGDYWADRSMNCRGTLTTKEVAKELGISTQKAYAIMKELESEGKASNMGIKERGGMYSPSDGNAARSASITWQIYQTP